MTTYKTNFAIGDKAFTVDPTTMRIIEFEVGKIQYTKTKERETSYLYPYTKDGQPDWHGYPADFCYTTREALDNQLNGKL